MAKMIHVSFVIVIFTKKMPLTSKRHAKKGKAANSNSGKGHDNTTSIRKPLSKSWAQLSNRNDLGTPLNNEVFSTYGHKCDNQDPNLNVGLIMFNYQLQPIV